MKATHNGHCQLCGALQAANPKYNSKALAKHGYAVRWNMFVGVCGGSGHQPFEMGIDLILDAIERAKKSAAGLRSQAAAERAKLDGNKTMHLVHLQATWKDRTSRRVWQEVELSEEKTPSGFNFFTCVVEERDQQGNTKPAKKQVGHGMTLAEAVKAGREGFAQHLENEAKKFDEYAAWQLGRIQGWQPAPLLERK